MSRKDINGVPGGNTVPHAHSDMASDDERVSPQSASSDPDSGRSGASRAPVFGAEAPQLDPPFSGSAVDETDESRPLEEDLQMLKDRVLRQAAEFQNFRKRVEQERKSDVKFGESLVLQEMLDVYDDLRRSIEAAAESDETAPANQQAMFQGLRDGVELVYKKFTDVLERFGVEPIEAVGAAFDEHDHEAMLQQPAPEGTPPGMVLSEIQKGYRMGDRVLRHSKVVVSS